jgi:hypothetical protein
MFTVFAYTESGKTAIEDHDSFANAIASAGYFMDTGDFISVTVEVETGPSTDLYVTVYSA